jgi:putative protease
MANGADAVYFGLQSGFNARARAANFTLEEVAQAIELLHRCGGKGYVTLNTLVFSSELRDIEKLIQRIAKTQVDAVLVQDLGLVQLIRAICPDLPIHASTQMSLTTSEGVEFARRLGVERVVLARELSIHEIARIRRETNVELEVFVHGALCVAYSGQCLTSESLGGRSANRGQCAQACRLPYELVCDGEQRDLGEQKYLLSPQDLAAYDLTRELIDAGVSCFKIEGRLKTAEYVANITRHYRTAIDTALAGKPVKFTPRDIEEMELSFSRGFSHGWLKGCDHKSLVPALSSSKRGVLLGVVMQIHGNRVAVRLCSTVKPGDGVVFAGDRAAGNEQGGRVYEVFVEGRRQRSSIGTGEVELAFGRGDIDLKKTYLGQEIWKTDDPEMTSKWRKTYSGNDVAKRITVNLTVDAEVGRCLSVTATTDAGHSCCVTTNAPLDAAIRHPLTSAVLEKQFGRLGNTPFRLGSLQTKITGSPMAPLSVLGKLRHDLVRQLERVTLTRPPRQVAAQSVLPCLQPTSAEIRETQEASREKSPKLHILCRTLEQLQVVLSCGQKSVYADFQDIREFRQAVKAAHEARAKIYLATPRIEKPGEVGVFRALLRQNADGVLVRNLGGLTFFREHGVDTVADFSLNIANETTAKVLYEHGLQRLTPSYDLNRDQLLELVGAVPASWLELVIHQHMPMFHMEHCVFCAVLSPGTNKTNCGRPCDHHTVALRDRLGLEHPLKADVGCRNTLFNSTAQSAAEIMPQLLGQGVRHFRIELLDNPPCEVENLLQLYEKLLQGKVTGKQVWSTLKASNRVGITRGTLEERRNPLAIV